MKAAAPLWPKIVAVIFSIALAAGYVGWRKHQADKAAALAAENAQQDSQEAVKDMTLMLSSKSAGPDIQFIDLEDGEDPSEIGKILMSSSKSDRAISLNEEEIQKLLQQAAEVNESGDWGDPPSSEEPQRTLMPGSKTIGGHLRLLPEPTQPMPPEEP